MRFAAVALAIAVLAPPLAAQTQIAGKSPRIGYLGAGPAKCSLNSRDESFYKSLREIGYVPGQNVTLDHKCFSTADEMRKLLSEFVKRRVDVIVVGAPAPAIAARDATRDIPIVCASCGDPLDNGLVTSLARPGGNVTGLASLSAELIGKRLGLLREAIPGISRVAALLNPDNPGTRPTVKALDDAGRAMGIEIRRVEFRNTGDFERAFQSAATAGASAMLLQDDPYVFAGRKQLARLALKHRLATVAGVLESVEEGALMAYGPNRVDLYRRAAGFVDKILKGAKPADLPIEQPFKFDLVINLSTAKALGLTIPPPLLVRADHVIP